MPCPSVPVKPTVATIFEKGSIYWYDFNPDDPNIPKHPAVIVGRRLNGNSTIICQCTSIGNVSEDGKLKYPYHSKITPADVTGGLGLDYATAVQLNLPFTIPKSGLWSEWYIGKLGDDAIASLNLASLYAFDLYPSVEAFISKAVTDKLVDYLTQYSRK